MRNALLLTVLVLGAHVVGAQPTEIPKPAHAPRVEIRTFASQTLSDEQFLKGDASGPTVLLAGELRFPVSNTSPRLPAVIIMHGSGGINPASQSWAYLLNQAGYATFMVDSFSGRGLVQVSTDQAKLGRFAGVLDAFRAYEELARHPRIDPKRIAFIGTSRGGTAVIYTAMRRFQKMWSPAFQGWATFPLYPSCFDRLDQDEDITMPMHAYHGAADDYASKEQCKAWLNRLSGKGLAASNTEYPEAAHSFDNLLADTKPLVSKGAQSTRLCRISEQAGALINTEENKPFSYTDRCVTLDPSTGYNPVATRAMHQSVLEHLARLSKSR
jgi:dienelactone hydrolase